MASNVLADLTPHTPIPLTPHPLRRLDLVQSYGIPEVTANYKIRVNNN